MIKSREVLEKLDPMQPHSNFENANSRRELRILLFGVACSVAILVNKEA
jgi:hypothetical protein